MWRACESVCVCSFRRWAFNSLFCVHFFLSLPIFTRSQSVCNVSRRYYLLYWGISEWSTRGVHFSDHFGVSSRFRRFSNVQLNECGVCVCVCVSRALKLVCLCGRIFRFHYIASYNLDKEPTSICMLASYRVGKLHFIYYFRALTFSVCFSHFLYSVLCDVAYITTSFPSHYWYLLLLMLLLRCIKSVWCCFCGMSIKCGGTNEI